MRKIIWGIYLLEVLLIVMTLLEFIYLDRKLTNAIATQAKINTSINENIQEQSKCIRLLSTDCLVLTNIVTTNEYTGVQDE